MTGHYQLAGSGKRPDVTALAAVSFQHFATCGQGLLAEMPRDIERPSPVFTDEIASLVSACVAETRTLGNHDDFGHVRHLSPGQQSALSLPEPKGLDNIGYSGLSLNRLGFSPANHGARA